MALTPRSVAEDADRVGGDRPQDPLAVLVHQPLGPGRPDVAQRRQVGDAALAVGGVERQGAPGLQLAPVARVGLPVAADLGPLAGVQVGDGPTSAKPSPDSASCTSSTA